MQVPPPTWCPECRLQRRLSFCNERYLYKNICGLCGKSMVAMYPPGTVFPVYCLDCYRGDRWDPLSYGKEYDFNQPFFSQFKELKFRVPRAALVRQGEIEGSEYCNRASYNKNCYMLVRANYNENSRYSYNLWDCRDSADCFNVHKSELVYQSIDCIECYRTHYCQECRQCRDSYFLFDCRNCTNCIGCVGLRNKQYYIFNQPHTKDEYGKKIKELRLNTVSGLRLCEEHFRELKARAIRESMIVTNGVNVSGNWLVDCKDAKDSYQCRQIENGKHLLSVIDGKDCMDYSYWGRQTELIYETANCGYNCSRIRFANESWDSCHNLTYADNCYASTNLFGCVGLRKKEYCVLNRQYEKEGYDELVKKIVAHMSEVPYQDAQGRRYGFGEYFPPDLSTSPYNTTAAQDCFPLTRDEAKKQGYAWEESREREYAPTKSWKELPEDIASVGDDVTKEIILCEAWDERGSHDVAEEHNCTKAFRIIPEELAYYRRLNIPLPRKCFNTRHFERLKERNPFRLWRRSCACAGVQANDGSYKNTGKHFHNDNHCPNEFETSYAPDRPEIVYCEQCYQAEVV